MVFYADDADILRHEPHFLDPLKSTTIHRLQAVTSYTSLSGCLRSRRNQWVMRTTLNEELKGGGDVYLFNALKPETWPIRKWLPQSSRLHFVEDGLDAYMPYNVRNISWVRRSLFRSAFGCPHPNALDKTIARSYDTFHLVAPELSRTPEPMIAIRDIWLQKAMSDFSSIVPVDSDQPIVTDLILLPHTESISDVDGFVSNLRRALARIRTDNSEAVLAIKAHPRERDDLLLSLGASMGDVCFPNWMPGELLAPSLHSECRIVTGLSTFIVTSRTLLPARKISLYGPVDPQSLDRLQSWDPSITTVALEG